MPEKYSVSLFGGAADFIIESRGYVAAVVAAALIANTIWAVYILYTKNDLGKYSLKSSLEKVTSDRRGVRFSLNSILIFIWLYMFVYTFSIFFR